MSTSIRLKFSRKGPACYLGHLDMLRYFQKAVFRAGIDIRYSEGFNPHQIMSFAYPLGVSMETEGDYMDIDVNSFISIDDIVGRLNKVMNEGISIVSGSIVPENSLNAMASVYSASYKLKVSSKETISDKMLIDYLGQKEIIVKKEGKKGNIKEEDIRPGIFSAEYENGYIVCHLKSGSEMNIKPSTLISTLSSFAGIDISLDHIIRLDIFQMLNNKIMSLGVFND